MTAGAAPRTSATSAVRTGATATAERFAERARAARRRPRLLVGIGLLLLAVAVLAVWVVRSSSLLAVQTVEVRGVDADGAAAVRTAAAVGVGQPLASVDLEAVGRRAATVPAVDHVTVSRGWPHTLLVEVAPRTPVVAVTTSGGVRLVDAHGVSYASEPKAPAGVPLLADAKTADGAALAGVVSAMAALPDTIRAQVSAVTVSSPSSYSFRVGKTLVRWGDASEPRLKVQDLVALLRTSPRVIDVSAPYAPATS